MLVFKLLTKVSQGGGLTNFSLKLVSVLFVEPFPNGAVPKQLKISKTYKILFYLFLSDESPKIVKIICNVFKNKFGPSNGPKQLTTILVNMLYYPKQMINLLCWLKLDYL